MGYGLRSPHLIGAAVLVYLFRRRLPDPVLFFKHLGRVRALKADIAQNAENATARRDLAKIWLEKRRPGRALPLIAEALRRDPESVELLFLEGKARLLAGDAVGALDPLVRAAQCNDRYLYGEAYLCAGRALDKLRRSEEAIDAFERYLAIHSSSVEGWVRLAIARREAQDRPGAQKALSEAIQTFAQVPAFRRRAEIWWYLRARLIRLGLA
jgi:tetratricopeptide (TPR) repeat protein